MGNRAAPCCPNAWQSQHDAPLEATHGTGRNGKALAREASLGDGAERYKLGYSAKCMGEGCPMH